MRPLLGSVLVLAVAVAILSRLPARADGEGAPPAPGGSAAVAALSARVDDAEAETKALRAEVRYLIAREAAITRYLSALGPAASKSLDEAVAVARREGFEMAAIPAPSRTAILNGLDGAARELRTNVPFATSAEKALLKEAEDLRRTLPK
jgi:hypothetical protein